MRQLKRLLLLQKNHRRALMQPSVKTTYGAKEKHMEVREKIAKEIAMTEPVNAANRRKWEPLLPLAQLVVGHKE